MEIVAIILFLFWGDVLTFDVTHEAVGLDKTQPIIGMATEQVCLGLNGEYTKWGSESGCKIMDRKK